MPVTVLLIDATDPGVQAQAVPGVKRHETYLEAGYTTLSLGDIDADQRMRRLAEENRIDRFNGRGYLVGSAEGEVTPKQINLRLIDWPANLPSDGAALRKPAFARSRTGYLPPRSLLAGIPWSSTSSFTSTSAPPIMPSLFVERHRAAQHMPRRPYGDLKVCGNRHVEQAVSLIEQNLSRPYTVRELVRRLNTSERALYRAFREHANDTPGGVSRRVRLAHGHWLLANTRRTVTQVAGECGFADAAHFCRLFRSTYGETPTGFREQAARKEAAIS